MFNAISGGNNFANISSFVTANARILQNSLVNYAAGQRVIRPANGTADYFAGQSYNYQLKALDTTKRELFQAKTILELAEESIGLVFNDLTDMMESVKEYFGTEDDTMKEFHKNKIDEYKMLINQTIENTIFGGKKLLKDSSDSPIFEVILDKNNMENKFIISFGKDLEVDLSGIDLDALGGKDTVVSAVQKQISTAARYMGSLSGMKTGIEAQININEITADSYNDASENALGLNDMDSVFTLTKQQIQQQAAVSMLSHGNMMRANVLNLIKF